MPLSPALLAQAAILRERSRSRQLRLRRPLTEAESQVTALLARGATYEAAALAYGARPTTVESHARVAADKILDGPHDASLDGLPMKMRLFAWARAQWDFAAKENGPSLSTGAASPWEGPRP